VLYEYEIYTWFNVGDEAYLEVLETYGHLSDPIQNSQDLKYE